MRTTTERLHKIEGQRARFVLLVRPAKAERDAAVAVMLRHPGAREAALAAAGADRNTMNRERSRAVIEAGRRTGAPTAILSDHPIGDPAGDLEIIDALANWERWVAEGRASVRNGVLYLVSPELTADKWAARFVTEH